MHLFNLDLHPDGGLQFLMIDNMVKISIDSEWYNGYLEQYVTWLCLLLGKKEVFCELCLLVPSGVANDLLKDSDIEMHGEWSDEWYKVGITLPGCEIWLEFDGEDELKSFMEYIDKWHEGILQAQELSNF